MNSNFSKKRSYSSAKKTWSSKNDMSEESSDDLSEESLPEVKELGALLRELLGICQKLSMQLNTIKLMPQTMEQPPSI